MRSTRTTIIFHVALILGFSNLFPYPFLLSCGLFGISFAWDNGKHFPAFIVYPIKLLLVVVAGILVLVSIALTTSDSQVDAFGVIIAIIIPASIYLLWKNLGQLCYALVKDDTSSCALKACFIQTLFTISFYNLTYLACLRGPFLPLLIYIGSLKLYLYILDSRERRTFFVLLYCVALQMVICLYVYYGFLDFLQICKEMILTIVHQLTSSSPETKLALLASLTCCFQWFFEALVDIQHSRMYNADNRPDSKLITLIKLVFGIFVLQTFLQISSFILSITLFFAVFEVIVHMMTEKREVMSSFLRTIASILLVGIYLYSVKFEFIHFLPTLGMALLSRPGSSPLGFAALILYGFKIMEICNHNNLQCIRNVCENLKIVYEEMDYLKVREAVKSTDFSNINWLEVENFFKGLIVEPNRSPSKRVGSMEIHIVEPNRSPSKRVGSMEIHPEDSLLAIGILVDFSYSMTISDLEQDNIENKKEFAGIKGLAHSIYTTIFHLVREDMSSKGVSFAVGFGAQEGACIDRETNHSKEVFDIIGSIENIVDDRFEMCKITDEYLEAIFSTLEQHGANLIRKWAKKNVIKQVVSRGKGKVFTNFLVENEKFRKNFIQNILPPACLDWTRFRFFQKICVSAVTTVYKQATTEDIIRIANESWNLILPKFTYTLQVVNKKSIFPMTETLTILNGDSNEKFDENRSRDLLNEMERYIFKDSPLSKGLNESFDLFSTLAEMKFHQKILFVLTDGGEVGDDIKSTEIAKKMRDEEIKVVCCYVVNKCKDKITPKTIFCKLNGHWKSQVQALYNIASSIPARYSYVSLLRQRGWEIQGLDSLAENEFKLFCAVTDPDNIASFCDVIKDIICTEDALGEFLLEITLDRFIDKDIDTFQPWNQHKEAICFACSSAIVFTFAMKKIDPTENIDQTGLREELKAKFLEEPDNVMKSLQDLCKKYPDLYLKVYLRDNLKEVMSVICEKRLLVATMHFDDNQWNVFNEFFENEEKRKLILKKELIPKSKTKQNIHHAVVLVGCNASCFLFLNSFGPDWGDGGFFRLDDIKIFRLKFYDIHCDEEKCDPRLMTNYRNTVQMMKEKMYCSLKSFQTAECKCPKCQQIKPITEFTGNVYNIKCTCGEHFEAKEGEGNLIALNFYLSILSRETRRPGNKTQ